MSQRTPAGRGGVQASAPSTPPTAAASSRPAAAAEAGAPSAKRSRVSVPRAEPATINVNKAVMKQDEARPLANIKALSPSSLQGLTQAHATILEKFGITTIEQLGTWNAYQIARGMAALAPFEEAGKRPANSEQNVNRAVHCEHEGKSLQELLKQPLSALVCLPRSIDKEGPKLGLNTLGDLADWKFAKMAEALTRLSHYEATKLEIENDYRSHLTGGL
eukprot:Hpha_TRINITY_DN15588_c0_g13::TRINITY_DN15588_c0_g13_i1::g.108770::m.108770